MSTSLPLLISSTSNSLYSFPNYLMTTNKTQKSTRGALPPLPKKTEMDGFPTRVVIDGSEYIINVHNPNISVSMFIEKLLSMTANGGVSSKAISEYLLIQRITHCSGIGLKDSLTLSPDSLLSECLFSGDKFNFILTKKESQCYVYFNVFCRMKAGFSKAKLAFFPSSLQTVDLLEAEIRAAIGLDVNDERFKLFGNFGGDCRLLQGNLFISELRQRHDRPGDAFFQFQAVDENDNKVLGASFSGTLYVKSKKSSLTSSVWKKRWAAIKGTSLFIFKDKASIGFKEVTQIHEMVTSNIGSSGEYYSFKLFRDNGEEWKVGCKDRSDSEKWKREIIKAQPRLDIRIPEYGEQQQIKLISVDKAKTTVEIDSFSPNRISPLAQGNVFDELIIVIESELFLVKEAMKHNEPKIPYKNLVAVVKKLLGRVVHLTLDDDCIEKLVTEVYKVLIHLKTLSNQLSQISQKSSTPFTTKAFNDNASALLASCASVVVIAKSPKRSDENVNGKGKAKMKIEGRYLAMLDSLRSNLASDDHLLSTEQVKFYDQNYSKPYLGKEEDEKAYNFYKASTISPILEESEDSPDTSFDRSSNTSSLPSSVPSGAQSFSSSSSSLSEPQFKFIKYTGRNRRSSVKSSTSANRHTKSEVSCRPCTGCNKDVRFGSAVYADLDVYHKSCFICNQCGILLNEETYIKFAGKPICKKPCVPNL